MPSLDPITLRRMLDVVNKKQRDKAEQRQSECVQEFDYLQDEEALVIKFAPLDNDGHRKGDGTYKYTPVALDTFVDFAQAASQGQYFNLYIKPNCEFERIG